ncbi:uncharacterized protein STEHIDRAFT_123582, partial [Stereum hirsutum FP-91666 SS1]|uniref:uncharacterized protein n=1 Tax=Stereum hirsutum (strain FP-91666) TaxID=721885 RepID=UPI000444A124
MPRLAKLINALHELPNLRRLYINSFEPMDDDMPPNLRDVEGLSLPALEKLSLTDVPDGWPSFFHDATYFPNIKKLTIDTDTQEFNYVLESLNLPYDDSDESSESMLCSLEGLHLGTFGGVSLFDDHLAEQEAVFFSKLKSVRILLLDLRMDEDHISKVTRYTYQLTGVHDPASTTCMPLLDTVFLRGVRHNRKQEIEDLVKARKEMGVPIRRLLIDRRAN